MHDYKKNKFWYFVADSSIGAYSCKYKSAEYFSDCKESECRH